MINCEIELDLRWKRDCVISEVSRTFRIVPNSDPVAYGVATFEINNAKLYISVVTLCINDNITFVENIKQVFKRTISWDKCRPEITTHP